MISANTSQQGKGKRDQRSPAGTCRCRVGGRVRRSPRCHRRGSPCRGGGRRCGRSRHRGGLPFRPALDHHPKLTFLCWSAARNKFAHRLVVEAVGVRFFAPGTTPEMPLRAATCREAQDGHRPCEAAGHPFRGRRLRHIRWRSVAAGEVDWRMCSIRKVLYSGRRWRLNHAPTQ